MCSVWKLQHNLKYVTYVLAIIYFLREKLSTVVTTTIICERYNAMYIKFSFSEKATKICSICLVLWFWRLLSKCQNHEAECANFCGLLRKAELYLYVRNKCKRIRNMLAAWDWLYEWMIKQAAQAGFYMTSSPNITGFFYNSENRFVKWSQENRKWIYFPLTN